MENKINIFLKKNTFYFEGELTVDHASQSKQLLAKLINNIKSSSIVLDLSSLTKCDIIGLQLIVSFFHEIKGKVKIMKIKITNEEIHNYIKLSGLGEIEPFNVIVHI
jgi:anti-anti-sigma factor